MTEKTRIVVRGPGGEKSFEYATFEDAIADSANWESEYEKQWRAMPWWRRAWSHVWWRLFGPKVSS